MGQNGGLWQKSSFWKWFWKPLSATVEGIWFWTPHEAKASSGTTSVLFFLFFVFFPGFFLPPFLPLLQFNREPRAWKFKLQKEIRRDGVTVIWVTHKTTCIYLRFLLWWEKRGGASVWRQTLRPIRVKHHLILERARLCSRKLFWFIYFPCLNNIKKILK